jgi:hypothetical protein
MLIDANLLLYAVQERAEQHATAADWLTEQLNGPRGVGLTWQSLPGETVENSSRSRRRILLPTRGQDPDASVPDQRWWSTRPPTGRRSSYATLGLVEPMAEDGNLHAPHLIDITLLHARATPNRPRRAESQARFRRMSRLRRARDASSPPCHPGRPNLGNRAAASALAAPHTTRLSRRSRSGGELRPASEPRFRPRRASAVAR